MNNIPTQEHIDTCVESRDKLEVKGRKYEYLIFEFIYNSDGVTCDEVELALNLRHQTASCFITVLRKKGYIFDTGKRRLTRSGRNAIIWKNK